MTNTIAYAFLLAVALIVGAYTASRAQTVNCTSSTFMGTTTTTCSNGSSSSSSTFMGTTTTTIQPGFAQPVPMPPHGCFASTPQGMVRVPCQ